jgi:hypothetical protein
MLAAARSIHARGAAAFDIPDAERRQLEDGADELRYVATAENHFPNYPSVLASAATGAIPAALELLVSPRYMVVMAGMGLLSVATQHPRCAAAMAAALEAAFSSASAAATSNVENEEDKDATPMMRGLNSFAHVVTKYRNKTELQLAALQISHRLVMAKATVTGSGGASDAQQQPQLAPFAVDTLDILRSQLVSAVLECVNASRESNPHADNPQVAAGVARFLFLLCAHRPPLRNMATGGDGPSVADLFAQVGPVLPALLRLGGTFTTEAAVMGPVCRILSDMAVNSSDELANGSAAPSLFSRALRHFSSSQQQVVPSIIIDCIRGLSRLTPHFLPLQIESLVMSLKVVMTSTGNVEVLTTCIVCHLHVLNLAHQALETATNEQIFQRDESVDSSSSSAAQRQQSHDCLTASPEEEQIHHARKHMRRLLELLQREAVPYVGAAYDHFADDHPNLKNAADALLRQLGARIRAFVYAESSGNE